MSSLQSADNPMHTLYAENHDWLSRWLYSKLGCCHQAADFTQDAFVRVMQKWRRQGFFPDIEQPKAYLTTVAGHLVTDHYRRLSLEKSWLDTLASVPETHMPSPQSLLLVRETLNEVDAMLSRFSPDIRTAFLLSQLDGLTYRQIAEQMQISERTVKRYMARVFEECILLENDVI